MGGLIQLVAYGEQDVFLTGDPKVTFFQAVYKRHTNFAIECIQQTVNGSNVQNNSRMSVVVARSGDLIGEMYIDLLTASPGANTVSGYSSTTGTWDGTSWMAERAIANAELTIGGQKIDKHFQRWWRLYSELYMTEAKKIQYGKMTSNPNAQASNVYNASSGQVFLPLFFFFNRNPGMYLPLIALQYHEVRIDFDISSEFSTYFNGSYFNVWGNYVFLDTDERKMFAQKGHEYLIEQVQYTGAAALSSTVTNKNLVRITYNHPVKELVWCVTQNASGGKQLWDFTNSASTTNNVLLTTNPVLGTITSSALSNVIFNTFSSNIVSLSNVIFNTSSSNITALSNVNAGSVFIGVAGSPTSNAIGLMSNAFSNISVSVTSVMSNAFSNISVAVTSVLANAFSTSQTNMVVPTSHACGNPMQLFTSAQAQQYQWCEDGYSANTSYGPVAQFKLLINGQDRMKVNSGKYFNQMQSFNHHTGNPYPGIYSYSFALHPEEHQPSGTCNFSRVDNSQAEITLKQGCSAGSFLEMFAINYNVLRIQSGMGGLAFSN